jgi:hypothetical protein
MIIIFNVHSEKQMAEAGRKKKTLKVEKGLRSKLS